MIPKMQLLPTRWPHSTGSRPRLTTLVLVLALLAAACADGAGGSDATGDNAPPIATDGPDLPDLILTDFEGEEVALHDLVGTPMVVNFWASWCPPCAAEMPDFEAVSQEAGGAVAFVGINTSDRDNLALDLVDRTGVTYDLLRDPDGTAFRAFRSFGMPTTAFVDADGIIVNSHTGILTRDALAGEIERWLGVEVGP
ncbi:hypothetical protein BH23ACT9_BH23ACT9_27360 [soil metagenome]